MDFWEFPGAFARLYERDGMETVVRVWFFLCLFSSFVKVCRLAQDNYPKTEEVSASQDTLLLILHLAIAFWCGIVLYVIGGES